jgi:hypothetical protein
MVNRKNVVHVRRRQNEKYLPQHLIGRVKKRGGSIGIWAASQLKALVVRLFTMAASINIGTWTFWTMQWLQVVIFLVSRTVSYFNKTTLHVIRRGPFKHISHKTTFQKCHGL